MTVKEERRVNNFWVIYELDGDMDCANFNTEEARKIFIEIKEENMEVHNELFTQLALGEGKITYLIPS
jgi:hypothetical protein